jgi:hypothetical protein
MTSQSVTLPTTTVVESVARLTGVQWDQVEPATLPVAAVELAKAKAMLEAQLMAVAEQIEATEAAASAGWASTKDFLTHVLGGHKGAGGGILRTVRQTRQLPEVREAFARGEVSQDQVRAIARKVTTLPRDPELRRAAAGKLLDRAARDAADATDLQRAFPDVVRELDPDGTLLGDDLAREKTERGAHSARFLSLAPDAVGGVRVKGYGTLEDAELIRTVLQTLAAPQATEPGACGGTPGQRNSHVDEQGRHVRGGCPDPDCAHDGRDPREAGARLWDALVDACGRLQATDDLPHDHGTTARIHVTMSLEDLRRQLRGHGQLSGEELLDAGDRLSAAAVRRLACDAEIIPAVLGSRSQVLDLGRAQRLVTAVLWLALVLRDRHCAFPGCTRPPIACDAHHIRHWADGGPTSLDNLVLLCRHHHTLTHHTPWEVRLDPVTRRPVWTPPPPVPIGDRMTHHAAQRSSPLVA